MVKISIGILGYNEEYGIKVLLDSLQEQTLLKKADYEFEIIVVSNGSYDDTVGVAKDKLLEFNPLGVKHKVVSLTKPDKCAAWNHFIHQASSPPDYYILLDADVVLINPSGLEELIDILVKNPQCRICGGKILDQKGNIVDRLVDGKCYAAPSEILRNIAIPDGLVMDDAYVAVTAVTNWYETDFEQGQQKGYVKQTENVIFSCGGTPRDKNISYWIACRKRTILGIYTQKQVDYCMRKIFGGGELAKTTSMKLFLSNPNWFIEYLQGQESRLEFTPPTHLCVFSVKNLGQYLAYFYCYLLSLKAIGNNEFGNLAWKLKHRYC
ncbi:MAG TPA: glycosyltransferase family A protein [Waterburya sp.]|jgi:glycosyltransferase involved in cell wall biosynthesis